jgi:hypothetical protein
VVVGDGEGIAVAAVTGLELSLEVRSSNRWARICWFGLPGWPMARRRGRRRDEAVAAQDVCDGRAARELESGCRSLRMCSSFFGPQLGWRRRSSKSACSTSGDVLL